MTINVIISKIKQYDTSYVCVTDGEPLAQKNCYLLLDELVKNNYQMSLETDSSINIQDVNVSVSVVMDIKIPSSGESE